MVYYPFDGKVDHQGSVQWTDNLTMFKILRLTCLLILQAINIFYVQYQLFHGISTPELSGTLIIFFLSGLIALVFNIRIFQIKGRENHTNVIMAAIGGFVVLHFIFLYFDPTRNLVEFIPSRFGIVLTQILATSFLFIQIPFFLRHLFAVEYAIKCKLTEDDESYAIFYKLMIEAEADAGLISLFDCYLRGIPQLLFQNIVILRSYFDGVVATSFSVFDYIPIWTAFIILPWTATSYHESLRKQNNDSLTSLTLVIYVFWNIFLLNSRITSIAAAATVCPWYTGAALVIHWLVATIWLCITLKPMKFYNRTKYWHIMFCTVFGFMYIFSPINLTQKPKFWHYFYFYLIVFCQNFFALFIFWISVSIDIVIFRDIIVVVAGVVFVLGILLMICYYSLFHPKFRRDTTQEYQLCRNSENSDP